MTTFIIADPKTGGVSFMGTNGDIAFRHMALQGAEERIEEAYVRQFELAKGRIPARVEGINACLEEDDQKMLLVEVDLTQDENDPTARLRREYKDTPMIAELRNSARADTHYAGLVALIAQDQGVTYQQPRNSKFSVPPVVVPAIRLIRYAVKYDGSVAFAQQEAKPLEINPLAFYFASELTVPWPDDLKVVAGKAQVIKHLERIACKDYQRVMDAATTAPSK